MQTTATVVVGSEERLGGASSLRRRVEGAVGDSPVGSLKVVGPVHDRYATSRRMKWLLVVCLLAGLGLRAIDAHHKGPVAR